MASRPRAEFATILAMLCSFASGSGIADDKDAPPPTLAVPERTLIPPTAAGWESQGTLTTGFIGTSLPPPQYAILRVQSEQDTSVWIEGVRVSTPTKSRRTLEYRLNLDCGEHFCQVEVRCRGGQPLAHRKFVATVGYQYDWTVTATCPVTSNRLPTAGVAPKQADCDRPADPSADNNTVADQLLAAIDEIENHQHEWTGWNQSVNERSAKLLGLEAGLCKVRAEYRKELEEIRGRELAMVELRERTTALGEVISLWEGRRDWIATVAGNEGWNAGDPRLAVTRMYGLAQGEIAERTAETRAYDATVQAWESELVLRKTRRDSLKVTVGERTWERDQAKVELEDAEEGLEKSRQALEKCRATIEALKCGLLSAAHAGSPTASMEPGATSSRALTPHDLAVTPVAATDSAALLPVPDGAVSSDIEAAERAESVE